MSLLVVLVSDVAYGFQQTGVTPSLPAVQRSLGASGTWTAWILSGYLIVASVSPVFLGKLADRSGKKRVFLGALGVFVLGSVGAALAPSIAVLVVFRSLQGVGGVVFPLSFSIVRDEAPAGRLGPGIGLLTGGFGLGSFGGYLVGGAIAQFASWRWVFGAGAIVLMVVLAAAVVLLPRSPAVTPRRLDALGAGLFGGALAALVLGLTEGPSRGWGSAVVLGTFAVALGCAVAWVYHELRTPEPLMDLRVLAARPVLAANLASLLTGYVLFAANLLIPYLVISDVADGGAPLGLAAGPLVTGLVLLPRAAGQAVGGPAAGPLARRIGATGAFAAGMLLMALGAVGLAFWRAGLAPMFVETALLGAGFGLSVSMSGTLITRGAAVDETGVATSINSVLRRTGGGIGAQASAGVLAAGLGSSGYTLAFVVAGGVAVLGAGAALAAGLTPGAGG